MRSSGFTKPTGRPREIWRESEKSKQSPGVVADAMARKLIGRG
jgi:hypothetical protein